MLKRQSKMLSIALIFVFCMSFMFAGFAAPDVAEAATTYIPLTSPSIQTPAAGIALGKFAIDIDEIGALQLGDVLTVSLPSEVTFGSGFAIPIGAAGACSVTVNGFGMGLDAPAPGGVPTLYPGCTGDVQVDTTSDLNQNGTAELAGFAFVATPNNANSFDLRVQTIAAGASGKGRIVVNFVNMNVQSYSDEIKARIASPSSVFTMGNVPIAKPVTARTAMVTMNDINSGTTTINPDSLLLIENVPGTFQVGDVFRLTLPPGFRWNAATVAVKGGWGLSTMSSAAGHIVVGAAYDDGRKVDITLAATFVPSAGTAGRLSIGYQGNFPTITPDDTVAQVGDVSIDIDNIAQAPANTPISLSPSNLVYAKYAAFKIDMTEQDVATLVAGKNEVKAGKIIIEEGAAGSIIGTRHFNLTLPNGVRWHQADAAGHATTFPVCTTLKGSNLGWAWLDVGTDARTIRLTPTVSSGSAAKVELSNLRLDISPAFSGPVEVEVTGNQGYTTKVKIAEVNTPVAIKAATAATNVIIGSAAQALPDIIVTEVAKETIRSTQKTVSGAAPGGNQAQLAIVLPPGVTFSSLPKVEVSEGDLNIDKSGVFKTSAFGGILRGAVLIPIKATSTKPSTIKLSDVQVTVDRTVAEGDLKVAISAVDGRDALDENYWTVAPIGKLFTYEEYGAEVVAKCVTPAPGEGTEGATAGQFKIDSNIYQVNGVTKVMDVAPYIKNNRTYVPVRYLGYALGVAEDDVVWDEANQQARLTKGDNVVELAIGSTTITVNGEAQTMDVAPEIVNNRTMLPARYVAEGLGYVVGWDPGTKTVLISK